MNKRLRQCSALFCALGILLFMTACLLMPAAAAGAGAGHSLTLYCSLEDVTFSNMQWDIYYVGERVESSAEQEGTCSYVLTGDFSDYPVSMDNLSVSDMQNAADTLENYAIIDGIHPIDSGRTDKSGTLQFHALKKGLYLLSGYSVEIDDVRYIPSAVLIELSDADDSYDMFAYPKFQKVGVLGENEVRYMVSKVWLNDENCLSDRSVSLRVALYCNNAFEREIVLDESNNWTYSWTSKQNLEWRVKEVEVPANYTVVYQENETQFAIINSHDTIWPSTVTTLSTESVTTTVSESSQTDASSESTGITGTDSTSVSVTSAASSLENTAAVNGASPSGGNPSGTSGKLPQTGQLWWPVPVLLAAGLILIIVGVKLRGKSS